MLNAKQRARLRALANPMDAAFQIGKNGISDNILKDLSDALDAREMVKVTVLKTLDTPSETVMGEVATALKAESVISIGNKFVLYRRSAKKGVEHIEI